jgi:FAD/FMN-containing dehydrogenase
LRPPPADTGYAAARTIFNAMIDRRPAVVARCTTPADVVEAVNFGRAQDLVLAVRAAGHNVRWLRSM